jgi:hypothetical protein
MNRIERLFVVLQAAGLHAPPVYKTDFGYQQGVAIFDMKLAEITDDELSAAADRYLDVGRFWPRPAELLEQVPHLETSKSMWRLVESGEATAALAQAVSGVVGEDDPIAWRQAFRKAYVRFLATPKDERIVRGELTSRRSRRSLTLNPEIVEALPKLLTTQQPQEKQ